MLKDKLYYFNKSDSVWKRQISFAIRLLFAVLLFLSAGKVFSQPGISSPYSSFGVGSLAEINNVRTMSMGGNTIGVRNRSTIDISNAASYSAFDSTAFLFEAGVVGLFVNYKTEKETDQMVTGNVSHILMGFPVTKWWRASLALLPYSSVGYDVSSYNYSVDAGNIKYKYFGSGGFNRFNIGSSFQPLSYLSIGFNASYLWGKLNKSQTISFPDSINLAGTLIDNSIVSGGVVFDFGVQYYTKLKNNLDLVVGATFTPKTSLASEDHYIAMSYAGETHGIYNFKDTIAYIPILKGQVEMPMEFGLGFSFAKSDHWMFGAEYKWANWSEFRKFGQLDSLQNSSTYSAGGEYIRNINSTYSYLQTVRIRFGGHFTKSYLKLRGEQLKEFGITFGFGFPLKSSRLRGNESMINIGFDIGTRGTEYKDLIKENYVNVHFSMSIQERWFVKRRYK